MNNHISKTWLLIIALMSLLVACQPQEYELEEFDINLPKSEITSFEPASAIIGSEVILTGVNMDDKSLKVYIGSVECTVVEKMATSVKIKLPRVIEPGFFTTINSYGARAVSTTKFIPVYPESKVVLSALRDTIFKAANYVITGENLDLVTQVIFSDTVVNVDGATVKDPTKLTISAKEKNPLKAKLKAVEKISFKCRAGNDMGQKIDVVVMDAYPATNLVAVDPKGNKPGDEAKFIFDNYKYAKLITEIKVGTKVASFKLSEPYLLVTIPAGAASGAIEVKNSYGVTLKYADGLFLTLN